MRVIGIIAEYNPFHNGHEYLISEAKKLVGDPRAVVMSVMSGPFVQRGTPSVLPKHIRAKQALLCGNDVVIELPFTFACAPSERFARGAVELLYRTGVVTDLAFGVDIEDPEILFKLADIEPDQEVLKEALKDGKSYPAARAEAMIKACGSDVCNNVTQISEALRMPNSILALDYIRAVKEISANFKIHMIRRLPGVGATASRESLFAGELNAASVMDRLSYALPDKSLAAWIAGVSQECFSFPDRDRCALDTVCAVRTASDLSATAYMTDGLDGYLKNSLAGSFDGSWDTLRERLATKHFTMPRIMRAIASLRCGQTGEYVESEKHVQYIRVLGFSREGRYCLKIMKKCARLPIIMNCSDALELMSGNERLEKQFRLDLNANSIQAGYLGMTPDQEWELPPVIVR